MKLKEIRLIKGLTQKECAKLLGISLRSYHSYETDEELEKTDKYAAYAHILSLTSGGTYIPLSKDLPLYTQAVYGNELTVFTDSVRNFSKRECYSKLKKYISGDYYGKVCILYGLRRTGKTTMMFQVMSELNLSECAYIRISSLDTVSDLTKDLDTLFKAGFRYVFIDEVTMLKDFIGTAGVLSDIFSMMGMKIVLSGTDSLGFYITDYNELYDRNIMIKTTFIPFREYSRLLNINSVDKYIEYGGTLVMENADPSEIPFSTYESTHKYIDSSIVHNIQHTLKNDYYTDFFHGLKDIYNQGELTNIINRVLDDMNHRFVTDVVDRKFSSSDLGSAQQLLSKYAPDEIAYELGRTDKEAIISRLKLRLSVLDKEERKIKIGKFQIDETQAYLKLLDLIVNCPEQYSNGKKTDHYIFTQPGMRYSIAKALISSLFEDEYFASLGDKTKDFIKNKILSDVKGRMLEEIVILEVIKTAPENLNVFKYTFNDGGQFDMVIYDTVSSTCRIYEIKHSDKTDRKQILWITNEEKCALLEKKYGKITGKYVIYSGKTQVTDGVEYINAEEFLLSLGNKK